MMLGEQCVWCSFLVARLLRASQSVDRSLDAGVAASIDAITSNYPAEVVEYTGPGFSSTLLSRSG